MDGETFGPYRIEQLLGRGGMGEVYRAFDQSQKRVVALKLLSPHLAADEDYRARFRRESELAARLREAHVIPIHRYGEIDGRLFIDMRLVEGADLAALLEQRGALPPDRAVAIVSQVARALDAAHADGLIHRDVKPSNVLMSDRDDDGDDDFVYLVDFGIARAAEDEGGLTKTGSAVGSFDYMAPERFLEGRVDRRTDVYSLACLLYECLAGRRPFTGEGLPALMYGHLNTPPPRPSEVVPGLPVAMDDVIAKGMSKDPEQRFAKAGDLAAAARRALRINTGPGFAAPPPPAAQAGPYPPSQSQDYFLGSYVPPGTQSNPQIPQLAQFPITGPPQPAVPGPDAAPPGGGYGPPPGPYGPPTGQYGPPPGQYGPPTGPSGPGRPPTGPNPAAGAVGPRSRLNKNSAMLIVGATFLVVALVTVIALLVNKADSNNQAIPTTTTTSERLAETTTTESSSSEESSPEPTPEEGPPPAAGSVPPAGGADAATDALAMGCYNGDMQACDDLYAATANGSPPNPTEALQPYFDYAFTCGDRLSEDEVAERYCVDIWPDA